MWELDFNEDSKAPVFGKEFAKGEVVCYLQTPHGIEAVRAVDGSKLVSVEKEQGQTAVKGDAICWMEKAEVKAEAKAAEAKAKKADTEIIAGNESKWKMTKNHK
jgi:hypothetical protein